MDFIKVLLVNLQNVYYTKHIRSTRNVNGGDTMKQNKLIIARYKLGFNQQDMANLLGITKSAYSLKENGKRGFTQKELSVIFTRLKSIDPALNMEDIFLLN